MVKTTRIIHHNQLLFIKFGKNLRHIESMTSKVEPTKNYWTNDVKIRPLWITPSLICRILQILRKPNSIIANYCSFKIFSRFWLVKTTRITHHNQLLFTKFGKNLRHIESMMSKVELTENYWTNDVKMTSKVQRAADYWTVDRENLGTRLCYIWWAEKLRA